MTGTHPLLSTDFSASYRGKGEVLRDFRLDVAAGEIVGLVGQSGSGKSTAALSLMRLAEMNGARVTGQIWLDSRDMTKLPERDLRKIRGRELALVLQSPLTALNPVLRIGTQLGEAWRAHERRNRQREASAIREAMLSVNLPGESEFLRRYPNQLSVGQAQRVLIAMAVLHRPRLLIADEPTSALDVITQAEVLRLFARLSREREMAILFISHDLLSVASLCERVAILDQGSIVECAKTEAIFNNASHPYTRQLVASIPKLGAAEGSLVALGHATNVVTPVADSINRP